MGRHRNRLITAALLAASAGLWAAAFITPGLGTDRDEISDCRGLGIAAVVLLGFWLMIIPLYRRVVDLLRRIERRQDAQDAAWSTYHEGEAAARGGRPAALRPVDGRHVS